MSYELAFKESALKEWRKLDRPIQLQFKKKLAERLQHPRVATDRLRGLPNCYKIKLRHAGYRLVYEVDDQRIVVTVIAVGRRDRMTAYRKAARRI